MKISMLLLVVAAASALAAPVEEPAKEKRGLHLGLGYHAPLLASSHYVAPAVVHSTSYVHHAPLVHAPAYVAHAPLLAHHPVSYHLPSYHSFHHLK